MRATNSTVQIRHVHLPFFHCLEVVHVVSLFDHYKKRCLGANSKAQGKLVYQLRICLGLECMGNLPLNVSAFFTVMYSTFNSEAIEKFVKKLKILIFLFSSFTIDWLALNILVRIIGFIKPIKKTYFNK